MRVHQQKNQSMAIKTGEKRCGHCKKVRPLGEYHRKAAAPDGHQDWCKECMRERLRERYIKEQRKEIAAKEQSKPARKPQDPKPATPPATERTPESGRNLLDPQPAPRFLQANGYYFNPQTIALIDRTKAGAVEVVTTILDINSAGQAQNARFILSDSEAAAILDYMAGTSDGSAKALAEARALIDDLHQQIDRAASETETHRRWAASTAEAATRSFDLLSRMLDAHRAMSGGAVCPCPWCVDARALIGA